MDHGQPVATRAKGRVGQPIVLLSAIMLVISAVVMVAFAANSGKSRLARRLGVVDPTKFFTERIHAGMSAAEVAHAAPGPDTVEYFAGDGKVVQRLVYRVAFAPDYQVNVVYKAGRVADVEFEERYLGSTSEISAATADSLMGKQ